MAAARRVDTTGAGDFYAAGFLAGLCEWLSLRQCGTIGAITAGMVIEVVGTTFGEDAFERHLPAGQQGQAPRNTSFGIQIPDKHTKLRRKHEATPPTRDVLFSPIPRSYRSGIPGAPPTARDRRRFPRDPSPSAGAGASGLAGRHGQRQQQRRSPLRDLERAGLRHVQP